MAKKTTKKGTKKPATPVQAESTPKSPAAAARDRKTSGRLREKNVTATLQPASTSAHSRIDPSCPPHTADTR